MNNKIYQQIHNFWHDLLTNFFISDSAPAQWHSPWLNTNFNNGEPMQDGNPIYSTINHKMKIGIRVLLDDEINRIEHYDDIFDKGGENILNLVLVSPYILNDKQSDEAKIIVSKWLKIQNQKYALSIWNTMINDLYEIGMEPVVTIETDDTQTEERINKRTKIKFNQHFDRHGSNASRIVDSWPEWKRILSQKILKPTPE